MPTRRYHTLPALQKHDAALKSPMHSHQTDYSRYFALKQKVFLINMSEGRDKEHYESLSGYVVARHWDVVELHMFYPVDQESPDSAAQKTCYKLTSESLGSGIQVMADLVKVARGNILHLRLRGNLELFQRRKTPRVDTTVKLFYFRRDIALTLFRNEWKRVSGYMKTKGLPPGLVLRDTPVNLSIGGIRLSIGANTQPSALSMFVLDVDDGLPPVCALAETVWIGHENDEVICGHRFIQIRKADQERINLYVQAVQKRTGIAAPPSKNYWELLDRMTFNGDGAEPKP